MQSIHTFLSPQTCPTCLSETTRRSERRGLGEFLLHWLLCTSPYRCRDCHERYFGFRFAFTPKELREGHTAPVVPAHK